MADNFRYSTSFEPIMLEGQTVTLLGSGLPVEGLNVVCRGVGALPEYFKDFGALTAATWDLDQEDTNLEMNKMELAQLRFRVIDDMKVLLKNPSAVKQWRTLRTDFYLPMFPQNESDQFLKEYYWRASEFFVFESDNTPRFDLYSTFAQTTAVILFSGWRFRLAKITEKGKFPIFINSWPS